MLYKRVILFFLLSLTLNITYSQQAPEFLKGKKAKIHFQLINNLIVIPVQLNNVPMNFLLDTGVDNTLLFDGNQDYVPLKNVQQFKFKSAEKDAVIEGIKSEGNQLLIDGQLIFRESNCYVVYDNNLDIAAYMGIPVHGILGYDFFKDFPVEINYDKSLIYVYKDRKQFDKSRKRAKEVSISLEKNKPYLNSDIFLNNRKENAILLLDIGNSNSFYLYEDFIRPEYSLNGLEAYLGQGIRGDIYGILSRLREIELLGFRFNEPIISVPYKEHYENLSTIPGRTGSIGGGFFRRFVLFIDYPSKKFYLKKGKYFHEPFHINMSGMEVVYTGMEWHLNTVYHGVKTEGLETDKLYPNQDNSHNYELKLSPAFYVIEIWKDSPAQQAGVQKYDKIIRINHKSIDNLSLNEITQLMRSREGKTIYLTLERGNDRIKLSFKLRDPLRLD